MLPNEKTITIQHHCLFGKKFIKKFTKIIKNSFYYRMEIDCLLVLLVVGTGKVISFNFPTFFFYFNRSNVECIFYVFFFYSNFDYYCSVFFSLLFISFIKLNVSASRMGMLVFHLLLVC